MLQPCVERVWARDAGLHAGGESRTRRGTAARGQRQSSQPTRRRWHSHSGYDTRTARAGKKGARGRKLRVSETSGFLDIELY